jgi:hypothetical protein
MPVTALPCGSAIDDDGGFMRLVLLISLCAAAFAQNSDLAILGGGAIPSSKTQINGSIVSASGTGGVSYQISYAWQFFGTKNADLHLEIPVCGFAGPSSSTISGTNISASVGGAIFLTPGVRYKLNLSPRVGLYGVAGFGVGWFPTEQASIGPGVSTVTNVSTHPVFELGGGVDFRMTRLLSLRGEVRDFVSQAGLAVGGRNHTLFQGGIGFHF